MQAVHFAVGKLCRRFILVVEKVCMAFISLWSSCAGRSFRFGDAVQVRVILDTAGGHEVKVIPCTDDLLQEPVEKVLRQPEPQWELPRPDNWTRGGSWGSCRVILFSGMK